MTYRTFVAGAPSAATAYALHLLERTVDEAEQRMAAYYARAGSADAAATEGLGSVPMVREDIDPVSARVLGITPGEALTQERLANILGGRSADGGELDGQQRGVRRYAAEDGGAERHRIAGVDLCFSAPKSVSVAWAFAETDAERNSILQAHRDARDEALAYIEREIGVARDGERGRLAWITVDHFTARPTVEVTRPDPATGVVATELYTLPRAGDPQLHAHCVVPNLLVTASGRVLSINRDLMRDRVHEFGAVYQAMLARRLRAIGVEVELDGRTLAARLPCIPEAVCEEFSRRTRDAQAAAREHAARGGRDWDAMPEAARVAFLKGGAKASREGKGDDLADADAWRAQAAAMGWSHRSAVADRRPSPPPPEANRIAAARAVAAERLGRELEKRAVLTAGDVRAAAARGLISAGAASAEDVLSVTRALTRDGVVQDGRRTSLIWRGGGPEDGRARVTTALHRDQEEELVRLARAAGADARGALCPGELEAAARRTGVTLSAEQETAARALGEGGRLAVTVGAAGVGKAQPFDARVLTPHGWRRLGDIQLGDLVTGPDGKGAVVRGVYDQGSKEIWRVTFEDGRVVECCEDHLWKVWTPTSSYIRGSGRKGSKTRGWGWRVRPLGEIRGWFDRRRCRVERTAVPLIEPFAIDLPEQALPIHPYVLGVLLGDGHRGSSIKISTADEQPLDQLRSLLPQYETQPVAGYDYRLVLRDRTRHTRGTTRRKRASETLQLSAKVGQRLERVITPENAALTRAPWAQRTGVQRKLLHKRIARQGWPIATALGFESPPQRRRAYSPIAVAARELGLSGARSSSKFVPEIYKRASLRQRLSLLQGLLDPGGAVQGKGGGVASFTSTSEQLARDVQEIAWSLGAIARLTPRQTFASRATAERVAGAPSWRVSISHPAPALLFSLDRKKSAARQNAFTNTAFRLRIVSIENAGRKPARCIAIERDDGLYVTDSYVVTHNTTLLRPLVDAWAAGGRDVWGAALAWRQAGALEEAGIPRDRRRALQPLLEGLADGSVAPGRDAVVVVDEVGQVGTRQLLDLLRLQARHGFKVIAVGDERQSQSIEAGPVIGLLREALGPKAVPEVLTTVRQRGEREREIAGLFRGTGTESAEAHAAHVARALAMKREDGTAALVPGGYREAVERAADLVLARRDAGGPGYTVTISAPTNADALAIGRAIRARRQARGDVGPDRVAVRATDGAGNAYTLQLAVGDRVRLFARTRGVFAGPGGRGKSAAIGDNGSVLEVAEVRPSRGLVLRTASGKEGFVAWDKLRKEGSGRVRLAYGDCLTIDSSQGLTSDEHVNALPGGSRAVTGFKAYVAESRHRVASWLVGSAGAELRDAAERRPMNAPPPGDPAAEAWENVARNLARQPVRETALGLLRSTVAEATEGARAFQGALRATEAREAAGRPATTLRRTLERAQANRAMPRLAAAMGGAARGLAVVAARVEALARRGLRAGATAPSPAPRPAPRRVRISEAEAQAQLLEAMRRAGLRPSGAPVMDGQRHYVPVEGNHGRRMSGAYMAFYDEGVPNALLWNYKTGTKAKWVAAGDAVPLGPEDAARLAAAAEARRAGQAAERARREEAGAAVAAWLLEGCRPADPAHPYLARKAVAPHGLAQDLNDRLVVPLRDADGRLWNLQTIGPRGEKLLLPSARKVGTFFTIGPDADPRRPLWLAEGFATAATVHAATGLLAVVALDASNLAPVAAALRAREPARPLLFAADNDHGLPRRPEPLPNVGLERARAAAAAVGGRVAAPDFAPGDRGTDWNDFAARHGLAAARDALRAALRRSETDGPGEASRPSEAPSVPARVRERTVARQGPRLGD